MKQLGMVATGLAILCAPVPAPCAEEAATERCEAIVVQIGGPPLEDYGPFITTHFTPAFIERRGMDDLQQFLRFLAENHSGIVIESIEHSDLRLQMLGRDAAGAWLRFDFHLGPAPDHLIDGLGVRLEPPPASGAAAATTERPQTLDGFAALVEAEAMRDRFSGAVIIAKDGVPRFAAAFGEADKARGIPMSLDTPINLGSMSKMFTGIAIAQLVQDGKVAYEDRVGKHLPDYPNADVRDRVTIHELLTHTSGLGSYWNESFQASKDKLRTVGDFARLFENEPLAYEPGSRFQYGNNGPVVLGLIIEAASGMSYYEYVRQEIFEPAQMVHTDYYAVDDAAAGFAVGYYRPPGETAWRSNAETLGRIGSPAGGGYASAADLLRFSTALMNGKLIGEEQLATLTTGKVAMGPDARYAYLFGDHVLDTQRYIGHNGGAPGVSAEFSIFPELGYTVIVLANYDRAAAYLAEEARRLVAHF